MKMFKTQVSLLAPDLYYFFLYSIQGMELWKLGNRPLPRKAEVKAWELFRCRQKIHQLHVEKGK